MFEYVIDSFLFLKGNKIKRRKKIMMLNEVFCKMFLKVLEF